MIRSKLFLILTALVLALSSCRNDLEYSINVPGAPTAPDSTWHQSIQSDMPIVALRNELRPANNTSTCNFNGYDLDVFLKPGLRLSLSGQLLFPDASPAAGIIEIEWACPESKGEAIRHLTAFNSGEMERAALLFYVKFKKNGLTLEPGPNAELTVEYSPNSMYWYQLELYHADDSFPAPANWSPSSGQINFNSQTGNIELHTRNTGWLMAAADENSGSHQCVIIPKLQSFYTNANSQAFLVMQNKNAVFQLESDILNRRFRVSEIEENVSALLVVISKMGESYYMDTKQILIPDHYQGDMIVNISPTITTLQQIQSTLRNLQ